MVVMQERVAAPSKWTVHAPQSADAAAEFRAGHADHVAQHPEQRRIAVDIDGVVHAIDVDRVGQGDLRKRRRNWWAWWRGDTIRR